MISTLTGCQFSFCAKCTKMNMRSSCDIRSAFDIEYACKGSFGGCQGQPSARPWHLLKDPSGLQPSCPPHRFVFLSLCTRGIASMRDGWIEIGSGSINPLIHA